MSRLWRAPRASGTDSCARDGPERLPLACADQDGSECEQDHDRANEGGEIRVDVLDPDLGEDGGQGREHSREQRPQLPGGQGRPHRLFLCSRDLITPGERWVELLACVSAFSYACLKVRLTLDQRTA